MSSDDWAIIIGISRYPGFHDLAGPENDARSIYEWVTAESGGAVPIEHVHLVVSSQFPMEASALSAHPNMADAIAPFERLNEVAYENDRQSRGLRVGRRLYLYMSGHGFAPSLDENALLLANATRQRVGYHVPGVSWARWLLDAGYFDELLLFMDCSRELLPQVPASPLPFVRQSYEVSRSPAFMFAFATRWGDKSRERLVDGVAHGVFTSALLAGLKGGAADSAGRITATSLKAYLYNNTKTFLSDEDRQNPDIAKEPAIYGSSDFVLFELGSARVPRLPVSLRISPNLLGKRIDILSSRLEPIASIPSATSPEITLQLSPGLYLARVGVEGKEAHQLFEVSGAGGVNVSL
jgi:hypothetical protein